MDPSPFKWEQAMAGFWKERKNKENKASFQNDTVILGFWLVHLKTIKSLASNETLNMIKDIEAQTMRTMSTQLSE